MTKHPPAGQLAQPSQDSEQAARDAITAIGIVVRPATSRPIWAAASTRSEEQSHTCVLPPTPRSGSGPSSSSIAAPTGPPTSSPALAYKERLIDYINRFIADLANSGAQIAVLLHALEAAGHDRLLEVAARREASDAVLEGADAAESLAAAEKRALESWRNRWRGLDDWFTSRDVGRPSQARLLRQAAVTAIKQLIDPRHPPAGHGSRRLTSLASGTSSWRPGRALRGIETLR
jgi:Protein of unknown function (DUF2397)